jgi:hypothetical protein
VARTSTPETGREHGGVSPILAVVGVAVVAFVVALLAFRGGGGSKDSPQNVATGGQTADTAAVQGSGCADARPDPAYTVARESDPSPPRAEGTTFHLTVRRDGKAVTGAKVCLAADMTEMHHAGIDNEAKEASGGRYDTTLKFGMRGPYAGSVIVVEPGRAAVSVPVTFEVT